MRRGHAKPSFGAPLPKEVICPPPPHSWQHSKGSTKVDKVGEQILLFGCNIVILHTNSTYTKSIKHIHVRATWHAPLPNDTVPPTPILLIKHEYHTSLLLAFKEDRDYVVLAESS